MWYNCVLTRKPRSANNNRGRVAYKSDIETAFVEFQQNIEQIEGDLYGMVYYFYKEAQKGQRIDADNLSKPIWDVLKGFLYADDVQIKLRIAGSYDLRENYLDDIDINDLSEDMQEALAMAVANEAHILYIECGSLRKNMYKFNLTA